MSGVVAIIQQRIQATFGPAPGLASLSPRPRAGMNATSRQSGVAPGLPGPEVPKRVQKKESRLLRAGSRERIDRSVGQHSVPVPRGVSPGPHRRKCVGAARGPPRGRSRRGAALSGRSVRWFVCGNQTCVVQNEQALTLGTSPDVPSHPRPPASSGTAVPLQGAVRGRAAARADCTTVRGGRCARRRGPPSRGLGADGSRAWHGVVAPSRGPHTPSGSATLCPS